MSARNDEVAQKSLELADLPATHIPDAEADQVSGGGTISQSLQSNDKLGNTKIQSLMSNYNES